MKKNEKKHGYQKNVVNYVDDIMRIQYITSHTEKG